MGLGLELGFGLGFRFRFRFGLGLGLGLGLRLGFGRLFRSCLPLTGRSRACGSARGARLVRARVRGRGRARGRARGRVRARARVRVRVRGRVRVRVRVSAVCPCMPRACRCFSTSHSCTLWSDVPTAKRLDEGPACCAHASDVTCVSAGVSHSLCTEASAAFHR